MATNEDQQIGTKKRKISHSDVSVGSTDKTVPPPPPPPPPPLTRSSKYWFDDGNIILQAGNTQFKVHRSVLAARCTYFRDSFERFYDAQLSVASISTSSSLDSALMILPSFPKDLELLLDFLYDGLSAWKLCSARYTGGEFPISLVSVMLRMGTNSGFTELRNEGIKLVKEFLPNSRNAILHPHHLLSPNPKTTDMFGDIIVLGHEHSLLSVLVPAYWTILNCYSLERIVHVFTNLPPVQKAKLRLKEPSTTLLGRERVRSWAAAFMLSLTRDKMIPCNLSCKTPDKCLTVLNDFTLQTLESADMSVILRYALCSNRFCQDKDLAEALCMSCHVVYVRERQAGWERLWKEFAGVFGLTNNTDIVWVVED